MPRRPSPPSGGRGSNQYATKGVPTTRRERRVDATATKEALEAERVAWVFDGDTERISVKKVQSCRSGVELTRYAAHEDPDVRRLAAANTRTPKAVIAALAHDRVLDVQLEALGNVRCPQETLHKFASRTPRKGKWDKDTDFVLGQALENPNCPPATLQQVMDRVLDLDSGYPVYYWKTVQKAVETNPSTPPETIAAVAARRGSIRVFRHPNCPPDVLRAACNERTGPRAKIAAENPNCPPEGLKVAFRSDTIIRKSVAANPNCPLSILEKSVTGESGGDASIGAASNPVVCATPALREIAAGQHPSSPAALAAAESLDTPPELLSLLARTSDDYDVLGAAAANPNTPPAALDGLYRNYTNKNSKVVMGLVNNPGTPTPVLSVIANYGRHHAWKDAALHKWLERPDRHAG